MLPSTGDARSTRNKSVNSVARRDVASQVKNRWSEVGWRRKIAASVRNGDVLKRKKADNREMRKLRLMGIREFRVWEMNG